MAELALADRDAVLRMLFGGQLYVGLARDTIDDEEHDPNYRRVAVQLSEPQGDDVRFVTNDAPILFPEYQNAASKPVQFMFLTDAPTGGVPRWSDRLTESEQLRVGGILFFPKGKLRIGIP